MAERGLEIAALDARVVIIREAIDTAHPVAVAQQPLDERRADETGGTGDEQDGAGHTILLAQRGTAAGVPGAGGAPSTDAVSPTCGTSGAFPDAGPTMRSTMPA